MTIVKLPKPPLVEVPRISVRGGLAPVFDARLTLILADLDKMGTPGKIFETTRTDARQRYLHGFGRLYDDGRGTVTYSLSADDTWHGFGLAADIISVKGNWNDPPFFKNLMVCANRHGCTSGADWNKNGSSEDERFKDWPHVQFGPLRRSPSPTAARIASERGLHGLWVFVGAA